MDVVMESDEESEVQELNLLNSVLEEDRISTEPSVRGSSWAQCTASTSSAATAPFGGPPNASKVEVALALNRLMDQKLRRLETIFIKRLDECRKKLAEIQKAGQREKPAEKPQSFLYLHCGKPYFKDNKFFPAPDNTDTINMRNSGMYDLTSVTSVTGWTVKDKRNFEAVILERSKNIKKKELHSLIAQYHRDLKTSEAKDIKEIQKLIAMAENELSSVDKKSLVELALPIQDEYDWDLVAVKLNYRHSPTEYRALWKLFVHPSISKSSWTQREHTKLQTIAAKNNYQDWDHIAEELDTNRTGYQCFVYYRTNMSNKLTSSTKWTLDEEEYLKRLIEYYRQDNYIPWGKIVPMMPQRTKLQMYNKYIRNSEKKGRFLPEEDSVLLTCVKKYGTNWQAITNFMNGRSVTQLRSRYQKLESAKRISCVWTVEEDKRLVQLMANKEAGTYAEIVKLFPGKDRSNIRTRHLTLLKWMKHHPKKAIEDAPRRGARRLLHGKAADNLGKALNNLKTRMTKTSGIPKTNRVTIESSDEVIEHSIIVTLVNEKFWEYSNDTSEQSTSERPASTSNNYSQSNCLDLLKILILLKASLNKTAFQENEMSNKYRDLLVEPENKTIMVVRSYSKKQQTSLQMERTPDIWGVKKLTNTMYVLPPNFSTIIGCKQLLKKYANQQNGQAAKAVKNKILMLRRKNPIFREQFALFMERFQTLFLWPMILSNKQPKPLLAPVISHVDKLPTVGPAFIVGTEALEAVRKFHSGRKDDVPEVCTENFGEMVEDSTLNKPFSKI